MNKELKEMKKFPVSNILFENRTDKGWEDWKGELLKYGKGFHL